MQGRWGKTQGRWGRKQGRWGRKQGIWGRKQGNNLVKTNGKEKAQGERKEKGKCE